MRYPTLIALALFVTAAHATGEPILTCNTTIALDGPAKRVSVAILRDGDNVTAVTNDELGKSTDKVVVKEGTVRAGLNGERDTDDLNVAEKLVVHAMAIEADPDLKPMSTGIDLTKVASATVYHIGPQPNEIGMAAVVVARDADGRELGSFLGGLLIGACK